MGTNPVILFFRLGIMHKLFLKTFHHMRALVEPAGNFFMLHPCKHFKYLINIENTESTHGEILGSLYLNTEYSLRRKNESIH